MPKLTWTPEMVRALKRLYLGNTDKTIAARLNAEFGCALKPDHVRKKRESLGLYVVAAQDGNMRAPTVETTDVDGRRIKYCWAEGEYRDEDIFVITLLQEPYFSDIGDDLTFLKERLIGRYQRYLDDGRAGNVLTRSKVQAIREDALDGLPLPAIVRKYRLPKSVVRAVVYNTAWTDKTYTPPPKLGESRNVKYVEAFGERKSLTEWCQDERCNFKYRSLQARYKSGWRGEDLIAGRPYQKKWESPPQDYQI